MSRMASSSNVQWSAEGATNCVSTKAHNLVNLSSLRSRNFDERTEEMKVEGFQKNENVRCFFT